MDHALRLRRSGEERAVRVAHAHKAHQRIPRKAAARVVPHDVAPPVEPHLVDRRLEVRGVLEGGAQRARAAAQQRRAQAHRAIPQVPQGAEGAAGAGVGEARVDPHAPQLVQRAGKARGLAAAYADVVARLRGKVGVGALQAQACQVAGHVRQRIPAVAVAPKARVHLQMHAGRHSGAPARAAQGLGLPRGADHEQDAAADEHLQRLRAELGREQEDLLPAHLLQAQGLLRGAHGKEVHPARQAGGAGVAQAQPVAVLLDDGDDAGARPLANGAKVVFNGGCADAERGHTALPFLFLFCLPRSSW